MRFIVKTINFGYNSSDDIYALRISYFCETSTSPLCSVNVMRRHGWLSHVVSVKHYEAVWF